MCALCASHSNWSDLSVVPLLLELLQDSMAMLRLLHDLSQQQHWPLRLVVGHCDHRVRPDSADNAAFVQQYCEVLGLPYMQAVADRRIGHWAEVRQLVCGFVYFMFAAGRGMQ